MPSGSRCIHSIKRGNDAPRRLAAAMSSSMAVAASSLRPWARSASASAGSTVPVSLTCGRLAGSKAYSRSTSCVVSRDRSTPLTGRRNL